MINVILIEPKGLFRTSCEYLLSAHSTIRVCGVFETERTFTKPAMGASERLITVLSTTLYNMGLTSCIQRLKRHNAKDKVLVLAEDENLWSIGQYRLAGADGYLAKTATEDAFILALHQLWENQPVWPSVCPKMALQQDNSAQSNGPAVRSAGLGAMEMEILALMLKGKSPKAIGGILHLAPKTVSTYKGRIFKKMGLGSMMDVFLLGTKLGLIKVNKAFSAVEFGLSLDNAHSEIADTT